MGGILLSSTRKLQFLEPDGKKRRMPRWACSANQGEWVESKQKHCEEQVIQVVVKPGGSFSHKIPKCQEGKIHQNSHDFVCVFVCLVPLNP